MAGLFTGSSVRSILLDGLHELHDVDVQVCLFQVQMLAHQVGVVGNQREHILVGYIRAKGATSATSIDVVLEWISSASVDAKHLNCAVGSVEADRAPGIPFAVCCVRTDCGDYCARCELHQHHDVIIDLDFNRLIFPRTHGHQPIAERGHTPNWTEQSGRELQ